MSTPEIVHITTKNKGKKLGYYYRGFLFLHGPFKTEVEAIEAATTQGNESRK